MSLIKQKNSPYYYSTITLNGRTFRKSTKTKNKRAAELFDEAHREEVIRKLYDKELKQIRLKTVLDEYLIFKNENMTGQYELLVTELKNSVINELTNKDILDLVSVLRQRFNETTIKNYITKLWLIIAFAKKSGYAVPDLTKPKLKIKKKLPHIMSLKDENKLLDMLTPNPKSNMHIFNEQQDSYDFCIMLIDTGARMMEIAKLRWEHVNLKTGQIHLHRSKVNNSSMLQLTTRAKDILERRQQSAVTPWVFTNAKADNHRGPHNPGIRKQLKKIDTKLTIHDLRHIYASRLIAMGVSIYEISKILGHSTATMTETYAHLDAEKASIKTAKLLDDIHERNEQAKLQEWVSY